MGVFTGFAHGSNPGKLDKKGQVTIVAPNPSLPTLASKSVPAAEAGVLGCRWQPVDSAGDAGPSFAPCSLVFSCVQWQYWELWTFSFTLEIYFVDFVFSVFLKQPLKS